MSRQLKLKKPAKIIAVMGDTGSGKSAFVKQLLAEIGPSRCVKFDFKREYDDGEVFLELAPFVAAMDAARRGPFSLIFRPSMEAKARARQFDLICRAVVDAGKLTFLVEELAFVTSPSYAPAGWSLVTLTGRHDELIVIGTSQRPASMDKNLLGAATLIHTGCLGYIEDQKTVAKHMRISPDDIHALKELEWIEYSKKTKEISRGKLTF